MNLLIVDDQPTDLKLLRAQLEAEGHVVFEAHDGVDALALLERQRVDVVISDILMPRMDGYRLCHEIRTCTMHDLPVIIYTATYTSPSDEKLALDVGADKYLKKPASVETLVAALHEVIATPHAGPRPEALQEIEVLKEYSERLVSKLAEKNSELIASEVKFRSLVEQSIVGIYIIQDDQFVYVNPSMTGIFGWSEEEMTSRTLYDFIVPEDHALVRENIRKRISGGVQNIHYYLRMLHQSGAVLQVEIHSSQTDYNGRPAVMGMLVDITRRKQAEGELASSLSLLKATMESTADGVLVVNLDGRITLWNHKFSDMWQIPEELLSKHLDELALNYVLPRMVQPEAFLAKVRKLYGQPEASSNDQLELADGRIFRRYSQPQRISDDVVGRAWSFSDITERKQAEETVQNERLLLRTLIDNIPDSIYSKDLACRKTLANSTEVRYLGVKSEADVLGKDDFDIYPKELAEKFFADDQLVLQTGEPVLNREEYILDEKQQKHWLLSSKLPLRNQEGRIIGLVGIGRDITERKQAETQLRQSQKMEAIGQLAGGVAHDFNNLLTGILGNIALMRSTLPSADPLLENLDGVETAARQATTLTKGLLTFSRRAMVLPVPMSLTAALDATLALLKQSLPATMEIVHGYEQTAWNVLVDQSQITQILFNLAVNARDAMDGKGTLIIRARNEVVREEYVQTHPFARTGEFVHLSVTDTGPGIPPAILEHLFEPFHTTKLTGSGTGLGLSIVYGAVKQADGWITGVSTEGVGTTFDIYLPRCLEEPTQPFTPSSLSVNVYEGTILVVEDEPVVCAVVHALLSRSGYTVLTAPDGASALNILRDHPMGIGLILLDMTMPGMTTGEVVQAIRALNPTVPILLNSGYTSNGVVKQMLAEDSVQGFLGKPYDLDQLLEKVQELLHSTEGGRQ